MDRGPDGAGSHTPGVRGSRRLLAGLAAVAVLLGVIAVLATRLADAPPAANAKAATSTAAIAQATHIRVASHPNMNPIAVL